MKSIYKLPLITVLAALAACSSTNVDLNSQIKMPARFEQTAGATGAAEIAQWWRNWNDPQLSALIQRGVQNNFDVAIAKMRLAEAQANSTLANADLGPTISGVGGGGASHGHIWDNPITNNDRSSSGNNLYAGILASWELDFFGKKRSDSDAALAVQKATQQQVYAAQTLVAGQIAESYFNIFALQQQSTILKQYESVLGRLKKYAQGRFNAGQANTNDILQVESRISSTQARLATFNAQIANNERAIAVLIGQVPQEFHIDKSGNPLINLPNPPAGSLPGDLLIRRPDLRASQEQVQAAAAKLASAKADLYPRFDIQFMGGSGRIDVNSDIPELNGWSSLISAGINLPIFTNGRIQANIDAADARLKTALLQYDKALIQALADVDNSYQAQFALNRQIRLLQTAAAQTQKSAVNAEKLFQYGEKNLDNTLSERINALNAQEQLIQARLAHAKNLVSLYKALGGGWVE